MIVPTGPQTQLCCWSTAGADGTLSFSIIVSATSTINPISMALIIANTIVVILLAVDINLPMFYCVLWHLPQHRGI